MKELPYKFISYGANHLILHHGLALVVANDDVPVNVVNVDTRWPRKRNVDLNKYFKTLLV